MSQHVIKNIRRLIHGMLGRLTEILRRRPFLRGKRVEHHAHEGKQAQQRQHDHQRGTATGLLMSVLLAASHLT